MDHRTAPGRRPSPASSLMPRRGSMETNLCRKGLWASGSYQLELPLDGQDLLGLVRASGRLRVDPDLDVLVWLTERYRREPREDRVVAFTLYQLGKALYGRKPSGKHNQSMRASLRRLKMVTVTLQGYDSLRGEREARVASDDSLIERIVSELDDIGSDGQRQPGALRGSSFKVQLAPWLADQIARGNVTYLDWETLISLNGLAKRLWVLLQAERYKPDGPETEATWIALGDYFAVTIGAHYKHQRQLRSAIDKRLMPEIARRDPRYVGWRIVKRGNFWQLVVVRLTSKALRRRNLQSADAEVQGLGEEAEASPAGQRPPLRVIAGDARVGEDSEERLRVRRLIEQSLREADQARAARASAEQSAAPRPASRD